MPPSSLTPASGADTVLETALMGRFYAGDEQAFAELAARWRRSLYAFFRRLGFGAEDAEDLCQEALLRLYLTRDRATFHLDQPLAPFLFATARNLATAQWRRRAARPQEIALETEDPDGMSGNGMDEASEAVVGDVLACAWLLPEPQLLYLMLCGLHGLGEHAHGEIAATLGRWPSQVSDLSRRALGNLRRCLEQKGYRCDAESER